MCLDIVEETGYEGDARYTKPILCRFVVGS